MTSDYSKTKYYRPAPARDDLGKSDGRVAPIVKPNVIIRLPKSFNTRITLAGVSDRLNNLPAAGFGKVSKFHLLRIVVEGHDRVFEYTHVVESYR